ncbi:HEPN domain-containing protein [Gloeobacter morelensis MG652769]|uniref:HEPN domain-containing protein n=1 Tax=Gloeobacter morelensis MG652769 TaxID=2781736 RepID=A0ABY3PQ48_9CYAN|nr:HEPN domain-containing protein [Gloeobacter morelensis MG652769]
MSPEQIRLLARAGEAVAAARLLLEAGLFNDSASRSYYAMFYCATELRPLFGCQPHKATAMAPRRTSGIAPQAAVLYPRPRR